MKRLRLEAGGAGAWAAGGGAGGGGGGTPERAESGEQPARTSSIDGSPKRPVLCPTGTAPDHLNPISPCGA